MTITDVNIPLALGSLAYGARYHLKAESSAGYAFNDLIGYLPAETPLDDGEWLLTPANRPSDEALIAWWQSYLAQPAPVPPPTVDELQAQIVELQNALLDLLIGGA